MIKKYGHFKTRLDELKINEIASYISEKIIDTLFKPKPKKTSYTYISFKKVK